MTTEQISEVALRLGVRPEGLTQITAKVQAYFGDQSPPPAALEAYIAACPPWDKLGMDKATFESMPVTWRLTQGQAFQPAPVHSRRQAMRELTEAELEQLRSENLDRNTYIERARALQATPAPRPETS